MNVNNVVWKEFAETTTCHGVREILRSKNTFWKIFWTISVLLHVCLLVSGCSQVVIEYFTVPTVTKVSLIHNSSLQLPRLAFCLPNGLNKDRMRRNLVPSEITEVGFRRLQFLDEFNQLLNETNKTMNGFLNKYSFSCTDLLKFGGYGDKGSMFSYLYHLRYRDQFCNESKTIHHINFGLCHVISAGKQVLPGVQGGYQLEFEIPPTNDNEDGGMWSFKNGLAIELEQNYEHFNLNPLLISGNQLAAVSLTAEFHKRDDNRKCTTSGTTKFTSGNTCFYWCRSKVFEQMCKCVLYGVSDMFDEKIRLCSTSEDRQCINESNYNMSLEIQECQKTCKPLCEEWKVKPSVTYTTIGTKGDWRRTVRLMVGYNSMEYKKVEEVHSFTLFMAVSNLGGQAGLWMGCSILTLIHAITYFLWAFAFGCSSIRIVDKQIGKTKNNNESTV